MVGSFHIFPFYDSITPQGNNYCGKILPVNSKIGYLTYLYCSPVYCAMFFNISFTSLLYITHIFKLQFDDIGTIGKIGCLNNIQFHNNFIKEPVS